MANDKYISDIKLGWASAAMCVAMYGYLLSPSISTPTFFSVVDYSVGILILTALTAPLLYKGLDKLQTHLQSPGQKPSILDKESCKEHTKTY